MADSKMLSIWFFVSLVIGLFGLVVLGTGIVHALAPPTGQARALPDLNPALWWGGVMVGFSILLFLGDRWTGRK